MTRFPDYYGQFRCLAGACPHTCCADWEVVLDEDTAALYRSVTGSLGEKLRRAMVEVDGETCFALRGGRCPFLDGDGLCEIHRQLGQDATSETCRSHPRFIEEYGAVREITLSASCPEANRLLLASSAPLTFPAEGGGEVPRDAAPLFALREACLSLLSDRRRSLKSRLAWLLELAREAQDALDDGDDGALFALAAAAADLPAEPEVTAEGEGELFPAALSVLGELEVLGGDWTALLAAGKTAPPVDLEANAPALERICAYFLFRWLCKAVNDGDILSRMELAVLGTLTAARLGALAGIGEALRLLSREVEHSGENLDALQDAFCFDERLSLGRFFRELA